VSERGAPAALDEGVVRGDRRALARAITLVESSRQDHGESAQRLLERVLPRTGGAHRVGVSGTPGVGKSTFIEVLGLQLVRQGLKVAVLAVDPSSPKTGGSLLGDKTRMERLSREPAAFIRPSPASGELGGVARRTREAMLLCEAAGFDVVLIETVGVGQSEIAVASMVDTFLLLVQPGSGDELQGVKRGVLEVCDVVAVTKADGELADAARRARLDYERGLHMLRPGDEVPVLAVSALAGDNLERLWQALTAHRAGLEERGALGERRAEQAERWMWSVLEHELSRRFFAHPAVKARLDDERRAVRSGAASPTASALALLALAERG
jgi:LAO/AO transport system kinase